MTKEFSVTMTKKFLTVTVTVTRHFGNWVITGPEFRVIHGVIHRI